MTPKEKAQELVKKISPNMYCYMGSGMLSDHYDLKVATDNAKECATILIDEFISQLDFVTGSTWKDLQQRTRTFPYESKIRLKSQIDYWKEVKKEIELL
jgi:hypothetical protein